LIFGKPEGVAGTIVVPFSNVAPPASFATRITFVEVRETVGTTSLPSLSPTAAVLKATSSAADALKEAIGINEKIIAMDKIALRMRLLFAIFSSS
jgi:hypothetical protein